jgi:hypothetical protein
VLEVRLMRALLVAVIMMVGVVPAHAQDSDLSNLWRQVTSGDIVRVKEASGRETRGTFGEVSASGVSVLVNGKAVEIPAANVREIRRRGDSVVNGLLLGAGIGAGAAAAYVWDCRRTPAETCTDLPRAVLLGGALGTGIGALVDAAVPGWKVAYRDNGTSFALYPAVLPTRLGVVAGLAVVVRGF